MKKNITVRAATISDMPAIHALVRELAVYENAPEAHTATIEHYERDFNEKIFESHVAIDEDNRGVFLVKFDCRLIPVQYLPFY